MKNITLTVFQVLSWTLNLMKEKILGTSINMRHSYKLEKLHVCSKHVNLVVDVFTLYISCV